MDTPVAVGWQLGDDRLDLRHEFIVWQRWPADPSPGAKRTDFRLHKPKRLGIFLSCLRLLPRQRFTSLAWVGGRWNLVLLVHCFSDHCDLERHGISGNGPYPPRVMIEAFFNSVIEQLVGLARRPCRSRELHAARSKWLDGAHQLRGRGQRGQLLPRVEHARL